MLVAGNDARKNIARRRSLALVIFPPTQDVATLLEGTSVVHAHGNARECSRGRIRQLDDVAARGRRAGREPPAGDVAAYPHRAPERRIKRQVDEGASGGRALVERGAIALDALVLADST